MHIILTGASGTVGYPILQRCLASPKVTRLSILSRRPFDLPSGDNIDTKKAQIIVHEDYINYPKELSDQLKGAEACIWAQGVSQRDVPEQ
jgi:malate/lactate dehydrogenase